MTIWTGCFPHIHQYGSMRLVSIARGAPKWLPAGKVTYDLRMAPTYPMMKMDIKEYVPRMIAILEGLNPHRIATELDNSILLCWEPPNVFCHRRMVAEWLERRCGIVVPEWGFDRDEIMPWREMSTKSELERVGKKPRYEKNAAYDVIMGEEWEEVRDAKNLLMQELSGEPVHPTQLTIDWLEGVRGDGRDPEDEW